MGVVVVGFGFVLGFVADVEADRLEHHVEPAGGSQGREEAGDVEVVGAEVVKNGSSLVEQRLHVDEFERPDTVAEDAFADLESGVALALGDSRSIKVVFSGRAEHTGFGGMAVVQRVAGGLDQDLAELGPAVGTDNDRPSALELRVGFSGESSDLAHRTIANEVRVLHRMFNVSVARGGRKARNRWRSGSRNSRELL
jgi:hypothetical protein